MQWDKHPPIKGGHEDVWHCGGVTCGALVRDNETTPGMAKHDAAFHTPRRGTRFQHASILDPDFRPAEGQKYTDAPKAWMKVTRVTALAVYFTYASDAGSKGQWFIARGDFIDRYGDDLVQPGETVRS